MEYDKQKVAEYVLALLYLTIHGDKHITRAWKNFDWEAMDMLYEQGYIGDPKGKAKSVIVTPEGEKRAKELFEKYFAAPAQGEN